MPCGVYKRKPQTNELYRCPVCGYEGSLHGVRIHVGTKEHGSTIVKVKDGVYKPKKPKPVVIIVEE